MQTFKPTRALSLVELLVSIGVIVILLALFFPALGRVRESFGNGRCIANLRQIAQAFSIYVQEHDGYGPPHWGEAFFDPADGTRTWLWTGHLAPYLGIEENPSAATLSPIFDCPLDPDSKSRPQWRGYLSTADNWLISYGYSYPYLTSQRNWWRHAAEGKPRLSTVSNASKLIIVADSIPVSEGGQLIALVDPSTMAVNPKVGPHLRHGGRFNAAFLDGHVESLDQSVFSNQEYWRPAR